MRFHYFYCVFYCKNILFVITARMQQKDFNSTCMCVFTSLQPQKERKAAGLLKLLSGAAAKRKPRSPPSSPPTHSPLAGPGAGPTDPTHHPHYHHHHGRSGSCPMASQGRAGSCPIESDMSGAIGLEPLHRKSGSLDTNFPLSPPATRAGSALLVLQPEPKPLSRERWVQTLNTNTAPALQ